jgi:predicted amidohydrolase YtcJ
VALGRIAAGPHTDRASGRIAEDDLYAVNDLLRPTAEDLARSLSQVATLLHTHGITAVHDVTSIEMLRALEMAGERFAIRTSSSVPARSVADPARLRDRKTAFPRVLGVKLFLDGSLGGRTAYLRAPYSDAPETRGTSLYEREELAAYARRVHEAGLQLMVHAIGDAALDLGLEVLSPLAANGNPLRHRLEHIEVTPEDLVRRLAGSGLRACVQPNFAGRWSIPTGMNPARLGVARFATCNAYKTLYAAGVPLAFGSDCMPLGTTFGLRSAVLHPLENERLDLDTALALYTTAGAELVGEAAAWGRIAPGMQADFAVWNRDPGQHGWNGLEVDAVFHAGRPVYWQHA